MIKILHFADAHIDMAGQGRHDPDTGLPLRVIDFLKALDTIVDAAIDEKVDLVLFAGDAYKDRTPVPTFQREWGRRILRLSQAGIPTVLLVGNHDLSPAAGRAHALQEFETLQIPNVTVVSRTCLLGPEQLGGLPLQIVGAPWVSRSALMARLEMKSAQVADIYAAIEQRLGMIIGEILEELDPGLPTILAAHASVQGAVFGSERSVMLGSDLALSSSLVGDPRLDYVALGHIHKAQDLGKSGHHPIIYPGSIEKVDWGEAHDEKHYIVAHLEKGRRTEVEWRKLEGRPFIDLSASLNPGCDVMAELNRVLPGRDVVKDAAVRLVVELPRDLESQIDEPALRLYMADAFEFHFVRKPQAETRLRLDTGQMISSLSAVDLVDLYWKANRTPVEMVEGLNRLAAEIISEQDTQVGGMA